MAGVGLDEAGRASEFGLLGASVREWLPAVLLLAALLSAGIWWQERQNRRLTATGVAAHTQALRDSLAHAAPAPTVSKGTVVGAGGRVTQIYLVSGAGIQVANGRYYPLGGAYTNHCGFYLYFVAGIWCLGPVAGDCPAAGTVPYWAPAQEVRPPASPQVRTGRWGMRQMCAGAAPAPAGPAAAP